MKKSFAPLVAFVFVANASGQSADHEHAAAVLELGGVPGWNLTNGGWSFGPTGALEFTPIENWLEIETGVSVMFGHDSTEWSTDMLFKKPWTLTKSVEFMFGIGPEWIHTADAGVTTNSIGGEAALDFMFWPSARHRFGWYLEPGYDYSFGHGHEQSVGISGGLLVAIP